MSKRYSSGLKAMRQNIVRRMKNRAERSKIRTTIKKLDLAVQEGNKEKVAELYNAMVSVIDKGVKHGILHQNMAARKKSRMQLKVNQLLKV